MKALNHHSALIYVMVIVSAADGVMSDRELRTIGDLTKTLPVFRDFEEHHLLPVAQGCAAMLHEPDSFDTVLRLVREALPPSLCETAYALALEIALTNSIRALPSNSACASSNVWRVRTDGEHRIRSGT